MAEMADWLACMQAARHRAEHIPFVVMRGFGISSVAYVLDALVSGVLVWMAAVSFKQVMLTSTAVLTKLHTCTKHIQALVGHKQCSNCATVFYMLRSGCKTSPRLELCRHLIIAFMLL